MHNGEDPRGAGGGGKGVGCTIGRALIKLSLWRQERRRGERRSEREGVGYLWSRPVEEGKERMGGLRRLLL